MVVSLLGEEQSLLPMYALIAEQLEKVTTDNAAAEEPSKLRFHATFQQRVTRNFWNASYMPRFDVELHANVGMRVTRHVSMLSHMQFFDCELHATLRR